MSTMSVQLDPEELRRNLAITLGTQQPQLANLREPQMAPPPPSQPMPDNRYNLALNTPQPKVISPRGTIQGDQAERSRLLDTGSGISQISHRIQDSGFGQAHPTLSKVLGGLAQGAATIGDVALNVGGGGIGRLAAMEIPGTAEHHALLLHQANNAVGQDEAAAEKEAQTASQNAEIPLRQAQTQEVQQRTATNEPVEISKEQADALGMPELEGEKVSPAVFAGLSKAHQGNTTKESTTTATNTSRENVAGIKKQTAEEQMASREKIAAATNAMRTTLGHMRAASGVNKGGPTNTTRAMAEMATTVLPRMTAISAEVDRMANDLGPAVGRWNELMVNKGGADHPEFAHLDTDLDLLASAIVRTHFGARGGQQYRQELRKQFGEAQSPEDLKQRIAAAEDWIQGYADMAQPPQGGAAPNSPPPGAKIVKFEDIK